MRAPRVLQARSWVYPAHIAGKPVGRSTYERFACRCEGCSKAKATYRLLEPSRAGGTKEVHAKRVAREAVEVAIARGETASQVMNRLGISYETFIDVLDRMAA